MPNAIVKLSSSDARAWSHNQPVWLNESGEIERGVTKEEQHAISRALQQSQKINQSFRAELALHTLNHTGRRTQTTRKATPVPKLDAAFEVTWVGESRVVTVWNGTRRYATGREVLAARLLADHGECILHGRNGKCIGVLRDPLIRERVAPTGARVQWSRDPHDPRRHESERSPLTEAAGLDRQRAQRPQRKAPAQRRRRLRALPSHLRERQRAPSTSAPASRGTRRAAPPPAPSRAAPRIPDRAPVSPRNCPNDCRGLKGGQAWHHASTAAPLGAQDHHPLCQHAKAWAATQQTVAVTDVLFDLEAGVVRRAAFEDEIAEANAQEASTGARTITIADRLYTVMSPADAEQAALEARGAVTALGASEDEVAAEVVGDGEGETTPAPALPLPATAESGASSNEGERGSWPSLDELRPQYRPTHRDAVSARDYLLRKPGAEGQPG